MTAESKAVRNDKKFLIFGVAQKQYEFTGYVIKENSSLIKKLRKIATSFYLNDILFFASIILIASLSFYSGVSTVIDGCKTIGIIKIKNEIFECRLKT